MKKFIRFAGIAAMILAAVLYALQSAGYLKASRTGETASDAAFTIDTAETDTVETETAVGSEIGISGDSDASEESVRDAIMVHVCGCVNSPGVYGFAEDARVYEAIEAAGGFTDEADETYMNLAAQLSDGVKIYVPAVGEVPEDTGGSEGAAAVSDGKVDINTADLDTLQTLPGIGPARAADIIKYRTEKGPFSRSEDIMNVPGIKSSAFAKIEDMITVR